MIFAIGNEDIRVEVRPLEGSGSFRYVVNTDVFPSVKCAEEVHVLDAVCSFLDIEDRAGRRAVQHLLERQLTQAAARAHGAVTPRRTHKLL